MLNFKDITIFEKEVCNLANNIREGNKNIVLLSGESYSGKKTVIKKFLSNHNPLHLFYGCNNNSGFSVKEDLIKYYLYANFISSTSSDLINRVGYSKIKQPKKVEAIRLFINNEIEKLDKEISGTNYGVKAVKINKEKIEIMFTDYIKLMKDMNPDINVIYDRFNYYDRLFQKEIISNFSLFSKNIILSDDLNYNRKLYENDQIDSIEVNYGTSYIFCEELMYEALKNTKIAFCPRMITDIIGIKDVNRVLSLCNGNINEIKYVFNKLFQTIQSFQLKVPVDEKTTEELISELKKDKEEDTIRPKLYLYR